MGTFEDLGLSLSTVTSLVGLFFAAGAIAAVLGIIFYVLRAAAVSDMSAKLKIRNPWYSFVPVFDRFALGRLAARGKKSALAGVLAVLQVVFIALAFASIIMTAFGFVELLFAADKALAAGQEISAADYGVLSKAVVFIVMLIITAAVRMIVEIICIYKVFAIFDSERAVVYTVLSVILPFMLPILLFAVRKNEPCDPKEPPDTRISGFNFG